MPYEEKCAKENYLYRGKILNLKNDDVLLCDGSLSKREIVEHNGGACVLYVENDEFDRGDRAKLNLGHTVGHAVESLSHYAYSHGLCVAKGIDKIIDISCKYYGYNQDKKNQMKNLLNCVDFDLSINYTAEELLSKIKIDKKAGSGAVSLILIKDIANTEVVKVSLQQLKELI